MYLNFRKNSMASVSPGSNAYVLMTITEFDYQVLDKNDSRYLKEVQLGSTGLPSKQSPGIW